MEFEVNLGSLDIIKTITYSHVRYKAIWARLQVPFGTDHV